MKLNAKQIALATGGIFVVESLDTNTFCNRCVWNPDKVCKNDLYAAIQDDNFDGHRYIERAIYSGARVILVERPIEDNLIDEAQLRGCNVLQVDDVVASLANIGRYWNHIVHVKSVGVYGQWNILDEAGSHLLLSKTIPSVFSLALGLNQKLIITPRDVSDKISTSLALSCTEHDTSLLILNSIASDYASLRDSYKIALPAYALITSMIDETEMFNIINSLPDRIGVLIICSEAYNKIKDTYLKRTKERGVEVIVFGAFDALTSQDSGILSLMPNVYAESTHFDYHLDKPKEEDINLKPQITLTVHADGFYDSANKEIVNQVVRIKLNHNSLDYIDDVLAIIALGCKLGISLYDIKTIFKC